MSKFTQDKTFDFDYEDMNKNKVFAAMCTVPALFWLKFVIADIKNSPFVAFYANQGLALMIGFVALNIASWLASLIPIVGGIIGFAIRVINLALVVVMVMQIINASSMKAKTIPLIGDVKII